MFELNRSVFSIYFRELIEIPNILLTSASDNLCLIRTAASREIRWLNIILIISRSPVFQIDHIPFLWYFNQRVTLPPPAIHVDNSRSSFSLVREVNQQRFALLLQHIRAVQAALQSPGEGFQRRGVEAVGKHRARVIWPFSTSKCSSTPPQLKRSSSRCENAGA